MKLFMYNYRGFEEKPYVDYYSKELGVEVATTPEAPSPENLEQLIVLAERLADGFAHVRVDFYIMNDGQIKFGDMTFTSGSGTCVWNPPEQNRIYGEKIHLPEKGPIPQRK